VFLPIPPLFPYTTLFRSKLEAIPLEDLLFSADLNGGKKIDKVRCRHSTDIKEADGLPLVEPELEGIKIGKRWAVIYSKYDIGCADRKSTRLNSSHDQISY